VDRDLGESPIGVQQIGVQQFDMQQFDRQQIGVQQIGVQEPDPSDRVWLRRSPLRDATAVVRTALVVLRRHWPVLFTLSFAGLAARGLVSDAAVRLAHVNSLLGLLVFIVIPVATLIALVLMIWTIRSSLPSITRLSRPTAGGARRTLNLVGSVLLPFLAVYASYGYLQADRSSFNYETWDIDQTATSAVPSSVTTTLIVVVVVAVALRALMGRWAPLKDRQWLGIVRAYLEIVWIGILASLVGPLKSAAETWLNDRRVVHGSVATADRLGGPIERVLGWASELLGSVDTVILVPIAWLAVGAVIYGSAIDPEPGALAAKLLRRAARKWARLPKVFRRPIAATRASLDESFGDLADAMRVLFRTGLASMLLFCLMFLVTQTTGTWLFMLEKHMIGPHDITYFWIPISYPLGVINDGIQMVLLVCLLGAAVDRVLRPKAEAVTAEAVTAEPVTAEPASARPAEIAFIEAMTVETMLAIEEPTEQLVRIPAPRQAESVAQSVESLEDSVIAQ
jgi:hypothetical protein